MIHFNNASLLSYSHNHLFLGENIFNYGIEKTIEIQGHLLDLQNFDGVSGVISGINDIKNLAKTSGDFVLNGERLGTGYITNISVEGEQGKSNWVRYANYNVSLKVFSTGSLTDLTGSFYDLDSSRFNTNNLYLIKDFSENYSTSLNKEGIYEYSHQFSFQFENGIAKKIALPLAANLVSGLMGAEIPFDILSQYNSNFLSGKRICKENYDLINNKFEFSETFEKSNSGDFADSLYSYELGYETNGMVSISEIIKINALELPFFEKSITKLTDVKPGSYQRCQDVYSGYYQNRGMLNQNSIEEGITIDRFNGTIELNTKYTNDEFTESGYNWKFESTAKDGPEDMTVILELNIIGHGAQNSQEKFDNAMNGFNNKLNLLTSSIERNYIFDKLRPPQGKCRTSVPSFLIERKAKSSYYNGEMTQTYIYSDVEGKTITTHESEASVNQFSSYPISNGRVITIQHPQKSIGRETNSVITINNNLDLSPPPTPSVTPLTSRAYTIHDLFKNTVEWSVSTYVHNS